MKCPNCKVEVSATSTKKTHYFCEKCQSVYDAKECKK